MQRFLGIVFVLWTAAAWSQSYYVPEKLSKSGKIIPGHYEYGRKPKSKSTRSPNYEKVPWIANRRRLKTDPDPSAFVVGPTGSLHKPKAFPWIVNRKRLKSDLNPEDFVVGPKRRRATSEKLPWILSRHRLKSDLDPEDFIGIWPVPSNQSWSPDSWPPKPYGGPANRMSNRNLYRGQGSKRSSGLKPAPAWKLQDGDDWRPATGPLARPSQTKTKSSRPSAKSKGSTKPPTPHGFTPGDLRRMWDSVDDRQQEPWVPPSLQHQDRKAPASPIGKHAGEIRVMHYYPAHFTKKGQLVKAHWSWTWIKAK